MDKIKEFVKKYKKHIGGAGLSGTGEMRREPEVSSWKRPKRESQLKL